MSPPAALSSARHASAKSPLFGAANTPPSLKKITGVKTQNPTNSAWARASTTLLRTRLSAKKKFLQAEAKRA
jgi:hypothetical protein